MLLNASHKLTFRGLPPDVLDAYVRYKRSTRALLMWFQRHSPSPKQSIRSLTIRELESLAQDICNNVASIPDVVDFYFREAISDRNKLSKYYRAEMDKSDNDVDTMNHEHFTAM